MYSSKIPKYAISQSNLSLSKICSKYPIRSFSLSPTIVVLSSNWLAYSHEVSGRKEHAWQDDELVPFNPWLLLSKHTE